MSNASPTVRTETDGPVLVVTIDRPDVRNAVDRPTAEALSAAFRAFDADDGLAVAVLTGAGATFCAGADLGAIAHPEEGRVNRLDAEGDGPMGPSRMVLGKPVIAAIEGFAVAGGLELALWCDLRVAATDATFGVYCRRWGVPLIDGGTVRLPRLIGESHARDLILTGRGGIGRRGRLDGAGEPQRGARHRARGGGAARPRAGRTPPGLSPERSRVNAGAGRVAARRGAAGRVRARHGHACER